MFGFDQQSNAMEAAVIGRRSPAPAEAIEAIGAIETLGMACNTVQLYGTAEITLSTQPYSTGHLLSALTRRACPVTTRSLGSTQRRSQPRTPGPDPRCMQNGPPDGITVLPNKASAAGTASSEGAELAVRMTPSCWPLVLAMGAGHGCSPHHSVVSASASPSAPLPVRAARASGKGSKKILGKKQGARLVVREALG